MTPIDRAISLTEPWATLCAIKAKLVETRGWRTSYRGWIAIHAAKNFPQDCRWLCREEPYISVITRAGIQKYQDFSLGCVVGVAELHNCLPTEDLREVISKQESAFGNYSDGRYGFLLRGARRLKSPIPMRGNLNIWRMPRPITEADLA